MDKDKVLELVERLEGYSCVATSAVEGEIRELTGREAEDVALDYNLELCSECGYWQDSSAMNEDNAANGIIICIDCEPYRDAD